MDFGSIIYKTRYLLVMANLMFNLGAQAQIWNGAITLKTQAQVDSFPLKYGSPIALTGTLTISGTDTLNLSDIHDLTPLGSLKVVGGSLYILGNGPLVDLHGLENLTEVGNGTAINFNKNLKTLEGLHHLTIAGSSLLVIRNDSLESLEGLRNVTTLALDPDFSTAIIERNPNLKTLGLKRLKQVLQLWVGDNASMENIDGLDSLTTGESIAFYNLPIKDVKGLKSLKWVDRLTFRNLDSLVNFDGFGSLSNGFSAFRDLWIDDCDNLTNLKGLEKVDSLDGFFILRRNDGMTSTEGMDNLRCQGYGLGGYKYPNSGGEGLSVYQNPKLLEITFPALIRGAPAIDNNNSLENLNGLKSLKYGTVGASANPKLRDVSGINNLELAGDIYFENNAIDSIVGLNKLLDFRKFTLFYDTTLQKMDLMHGVDSTRGNFELDSNVFPDKADKLKCLKLYENARHIGNVEIGISDSLLIIDVDVANKAKTFTGLSFGTNKKAELEILPNADSTTTIYTNWTVTEYGGVRLYGNMKGPNFNYSLSKLKSIKSFAFSYSDIFPTEINALQTIRKGGISIDNVTDPILPKSFSGNLKTIKVENSPFPSLQIFNNQFKTIEGFDAVDTFVGNLAVSGNDSLTDCSGICPLLALPPFNRPTDFTGNPFPCDTKANIKAWCDTLNTATGLVFEPLAFSLAPNPADGFCKIEIDGTESGLLWLAVVDALGRIVFEQHFPEGLQKRFELATGDFRPGIYQIVARTDRHQGVKTLSIVR